ncbi:MAG TPA: hypothetical protein VH682_05830, partial [Gemmataceae bacterium]
LQANAFDCLVTNHGVMISHQSCSSYSDAASKQFKVVAHQTVLGSQASAVGASKLSASIDCSFPPVKGKN